MLCEKRRPKEKLESAMSKSVLVRKDADQKKSRGGVVGIRDLVRISSGWKNWISRCANDGCSRPTAMLWKSSGISISEKRYCGPDCFETAAQARVSQLRLSSQTVDRPRKLRMPMGLVLLSKGILTAEQLRQALDQQRILGTNIGDTVQQLGFATEEQVTAAVAAQWGYPVFSSRAGQISAPVQIQIPRPLMQLYGFLPLHFVEPERKLLIGFVDAVQHQVLYAIEHMTSVVAMPCFITAGEYRRGLHCSPCPAREKEIIFERPSTSAEIARVVRNYVLQAGAEQARFGICRDYLWARVWGPRQELDLLFRLSKDQGGER